MEEQGIFSLVPVLSGDHVALKLTIQIFIDILLAVLFLQSGLDKAFNWKSNLEWITGYFSKTIFKNFVLPLLFVLTILEVSTGIAATVGAVQTLFGDGQLTSLFACVFACKTLLALFFGQRLAKDYPGAAGLVPYFIVSLLGLALQFL